MWAWMPSPSWGHPSQVLQAPGYPNPKSPRPWRRLGKMKGNGGKWGGMGGGGAKVGENERKCGGKGIHHNITIGFVGTTSEKWQKTGRCNVRKMAEKCDEMPMFPAPISPIFLEARDLPIRSLYKTKYAGSGWKNGGYAWVSENSGA